MAETYQGVYDIERGCMIEEKIAECHHAAKKLWGTPPPNEAAHERGHKN